MSQSNTSNPLPEPRLLTTTHTTAGASVFSLDTHIQPFSPFGPKGSSFYTFDTSSVVPIAHTDTTTQCSSTTSSIPRCPPSGVLFCMSDIAPNFTVPMHRTQSVDYAVVLSGQIVLRLDGGEERTVKAGECIVQGGTNHQWVNKMNEVCRIVFLMVGRERVVLEDGKMLREMPVGFGGPGDGVKE